MRTRVAGLPCRSSPKGGPAFAASGVGYGVAAFAPASASRRRAKAGFTLIEVLVALVVAVAAMALLSQGFTTGARASVVSQQTTRAALLAQRVMTDFETGLLPLDQGGSGAFDDEPDYAYESTSSPDVPGLTLLTVTVRWFDRGEERRYVLTRLMRERAATTP